MDDREPKASESSGLSRIRARLTGRSSSSIPIPQSSIPNRNLLALFLVLTTIIVLGGVLFYQREKADFRREAQNNMTGIARLKVQQIAKWREERLADAAVILHAPFARRAIQAFLNDAITSPAREDLLQWMQAPRTSHGYKGVFLVDAKGDVRLRAADPDEAIGAVERQAAAEAIRTPRTMIIPLHRDEPGQAIRLGLVAPVIPPDEPTTAPSKAIAAFVLQIDPYEYLYPLIQTWPTPSPTAETMLFRVEGDTVLYLNKVRHRENTALNLRLPLTAGVVATEGIRTGRKIHEAVDYRGVRVLGVVERVPDSPWWIVAKVDEAEVYAPLHRQAMLLATLIGVLILSSGFGVGFLWRQQSSRMFARQLETERRRREMAQRYEHLMRNANDAILLLDEDLRIIEANERASTQYGYSVEELIGMPLAELRSPAEAAQLEKQKALILERGGLVFETEHRRKDGRIVPVEASVRRIEIAGNHCLLDTIRDITERKRAEEALRESQERLRLAAEAAEIGTWHWDLQRDEFTMSDLCRTLYGLGPDDEFNYRDFHQLLHPEDRSKTGETLCESMREQKDYESEYRVRWKDGSLRWILSKGRAHFDESGKAVRMIGIAMDTTRRREIEEEIRRFNVELEQRVNERTAQLQAANEDLRNEIRERERAEDAVRKLNANLQQHVVELKAVNHELEAFCYSVSHDLRAPLRGIDGFSQVLIEDYADKLDAEGLRYLERVRAASGRMGQLIDDLLNLSRVTRGEFKYEPVNLSDLARAVVADLQKTEPDRRVEVRIAEGLTAKGDPRLLRVALENLIGNAWKFTGKTDNAEIEFGAAGANHQREYYVRDNGPGFNMEYVGKLFSPFQRLHAAEEFPGSGIGLATVQRIIHRHGGRVRAEAAEGQGATFYFTLHAAG